MDPSSAVAGTAGLLSSVAALSSAVSTLQRRHQNAGLNVTLLAGALATVEELVRGLRDWRASLDGGKSFEQLDHDVGLAMESCAVLAIVIGRKLGAASAEARSVLDRLRFLQLDAALKDDVRSVDGQIRALQLLRTIVQCKSTAEQQARLADEGSRSVLENAKQQVTLLGLTDDDVDAAASMLMGEAVEEPAIDAILRNAAAVTKSDQPRHSLRYYPMSNLSLRPAPLSIGKAGKGNARKGSTSSINKPADTFMTHHGGLPFLGIPFHGEQEDALDVESSTEEEYGEVEGTARLAHGKGTDEPEKSMESAEAIARTTVSPKQDVQGSAKSAFITIFMDLGKSEAEAADIGTDSMDVNGLDGNASAGREENGQSMIPRSTAPLHTDSGTGRGLGLVVQSRGDAETTPANLGPDDFVEDEADGMSKTTRPYPLPLPTRGSSLECLLKLAPGAVVGPTSMVLPIAVATSHDASRDTQSPVEKSASPLRAVHEMANASTSPRSMREMDAGRKDDSLHSPMLECSRWSTSPTAMENASKARTASGDSYDINFGPTPELSISPLKAPSARAAPSRLRELAQATRSMEPSDDGPHPGSRIPDVLLPDIPVQDTLIGQISHRRSLSTTSVPSRPSTPAKSAGRERKDGAKSPISQQLIQFLPLASHNRHHSQNRIPRRPVPSSSGARTASRDSSNSGLGRMALKSEAARARAVSSDRPRQSGDAGPRQMPSLDAPTSRSSTSSDPVDASIHTAPVRSSSPTTSASSAAHSVTATTMAASVSPDDVKLSPVDATHLSEGKEPRSKGGKSITKEAISKSIALMQGKYQSGSLETFKVGKIKLPRLSSLSSMLSTSEKISQERATSVAEAASSGNVERLKILLHDNSKVVDTWTTQGAEVSPRTPVMRAAAADSVGCLEILRAFGADFDVSDSLGRSLLHLAVEKGSMQAVEWLVALPAKEGSSRCAMAERSDIQGLKPLHVAAGNGLADIIDILIESGANIESQDHQARTPLLYAISKRQHDTAAYLVAHGCNIEARDVNMDTPLIAATKANLLEAIRLLLNRGANRDARDNDGETAIHHGARLGHVDAITTIHTDLTQLEEENGVGERPLHLACSAVQLRTVQLLLELRVQVDAMSTPVGSPSAAYQPLASTQHGAGKLSSTLLPSTPLHYACMFADAAIVATLIAAGASVHTPQEDGGLTPLMLASERGATDVAQQLLDAGAPVNASSKPELLTALHLAAMRNHVPMSRLLLAHGADASAPTRAGDLPFRHGSRDASHPKADVPHPAAATDHPAASKAPSPAYPTSNGQIPLLSWMNPPSRPGVPTMPWLPPSAPALGSGLGLDGVAYRGFFHSAKPAVVLGMDGAVEVPLPSARLPSLVSEAGAAKFSAG